MTDFLGNLILRSTVNASPLSILQPRLPSLFEPMGSETETPVPLPDPDRRDPVERNTGPLNYAPPMNALQTLRSTIAAAPDGAERMPSSIEKRLPPDSQSQVKIRTAQVAFIPEDPQRTIMPRVTDQGVPKESTGMDGRRSVAPNQPVKITPAETGRDNIRTVDRVSASVKKNREDSLPEESARGKDEPASAKTGLAAVVLQPALAAPRLASLQPFEQKQAQAPQQVVEVHIGRIEVRATPPSNPRRASQKATTMSLEEYLRSRPGEKR